MRRVAGGKAVSCHRNPKGGLLSEIEVRAGYSARASSSRRRFTPCIYVYCWSSILNFPDEVEGVDFDYVTRIGGRVEGAPDYVVSARCSAESLDSSAGGGFDQ